jgi:hypothetical protein
MNHLFQYPDNSLEQQFIAFLSEPFETPRPTPNTLELYRLARDYQRNMELYQRNMQLIMEMVASPATTTRSQRVNRLFQHIFTQPSLFRTPTSRLSNTQIANNTRTIVYDASLCNEPRCPVSLDDFEQGESILQITRCGHYFKSEALLEWFRRNSHCPVCRCDLAQSPSTPPPRQHDVVEEFSFEIPILIDSSGNTFVPPNRNTSASSNPDSFQSLIADAINEYLSNR